jgi:UPF0755 protein
MNKWVNRLLLLIMIMVLAANVAAAYIVYDYNRTGPLVSSANFVIPRNQGFRVTVDELEKAGVIHHALTVKFLGFILHKAHRFQAGEYEFPPGINAHRVVDWIVSGKVVQRKITVPEGLMVRDVIELLNKEEALSGEVTGDIAEGSLLPETYLFMRGDTRQSVVQHMQEAMGRLMDDLWPRRQQGLPFDTREEALTLASIVEKETGIASERPLVASVFVNRLRRSMRLQSDPTVAYGLIVANDGNPLGRALMLSDLKSETPYNTYVIDRLPPGPIACPGRAAIEAVLNPPETNYIYFVATGNGGHHFATSLNEHNRNVAQYRRVMREKR